MQQPVHRRQLHRLWCSKFLDDSTNWNAAMFTNIAAKT
ncbi:unnamed protein product [Nezara viridula]|uniref:Uncharacterized protein n=1 Tax=Nezara viridula TaxID=85310 RepID=A0A9P0GVV3_NEZVI|nr:unnamed protein product [Nezara viridula]